MSALSEVHPKNLGRKLDVMALAATGVCSMMGASIYIVPFMIQRHVPGIGPYVLLAFVIAAVPAGLAAIAYALLATAMPRAGGSYIFGSRGLHPFWGFLASFAHWFGLSVAIGVIAYVVVAFLNDIMQALEWEFISSITSNDALRPLIALLLLWLFVYVNLRGLTFYRKILVPMMLGMFGLGIIVVAIGFSMSHQEFLGDADYVLPQHPLDFKVLLSAAAILFASFIGFDSIAQAGGEANRPTKSLPKAIALAFVTVAAFYFIFTAAVYHAIPWPHIADLALIHDVSAPALFSDRLPVGVTVLIISGAALALINDLPAMLLSVSRLIFAWAKDGLFPIRLTHLNSFQVPQPALVTSAVVASLSVLGCHFAGDFFLGVDIMVTSMLLNFILICTTVWAIHLKGSQYRASIRNFISPRWQLVATAVGLVGLITLLVLHLVRDLSTPQERWYHHSTAVWLMVMLFASLLYYRGIRKLKRQKVNIFERFSTLPDE